MRFFREFTLIKSLDSAAENFYIKQIKQKKMKNRLQPVFTILLLIFAFLFLINNLYAGFIEECVTGNNTTVNGEDSFTYLSNRGFYPQSYNGPDKNSNIQINVFSTYGHRVTNNFCLPGGLICLVRMNLVPFANCNSYNVSVTDYSGNGNTGPGLFHLSLAVPEILSSEDSLLIIESSYIFETQISNALGFENIELTPGNYKIDNNGEVVANAVINGMSHIQIDVNFCNRVFPNPDTVKVLLANPFAPFEIIDSTIVFTQVDGLKFRVQPSFSNASSGNSYYLILKHRNSIETWSSNLVLISNEPVMYDFTSSVSQAFGNNMQLIGGLAYTYGGDVNQDGFVDLNDLVTTSNAASGFVSGYVVTDVNGDLSVTLEDILIVYNSAAAFAEVKVPQ